MNFKIFIGSYIGQNLGMGFNAVFAYPFDDLQLPTLLTSIFTLIKLQHLILNDMVRISSVLCCPTSECAIM